MQLKVSNKYKRVGTDSGFTTQTGDIVIITKTTSTTIHFERTSCDYDELSLSIKKFQREFILTKKSISFKGIL